eukprot:scaffold30281_cov42-Attheya_sp.AAC.2
MSGFVHTMSMRTRHGMQFGCGVLKAFTKPTKTAQYNEVDWGIISIEDFGRMGFEVVGVMFVIGC